MTGERLDNLILLLTSLSFHPHSPYTYQNVIIFLPDGEVSIEVPGSEEDPDLPSNPSEITANSNPTTAEVGAEQLLREECEQLFNYFNHKNLDAILRATKLSLDLIRKKVFFTAYVEFPCEFEIILKPIYI